MGFRVPVSPRRRARFALALSAVVLSILVPVRARAQLDVRSKILVSTEWLASHLSDRNLVLLHVGEKAQYDKEHLPGARFVGLDDIADSDHETPGALMLQMPSGEKLREKLAALGISDASRVVVYYGDDWVTPATRVIFTLDYAGLGNQSSLLDGGMQQWKRENRPVTTAVPAITTGSLSALRTRPIIVDAEWVKSNIGKVGISVIDGRSASFYDGVQTGGGMRGVKHRTGHIAGAKSVPFTEISDEKLFIKSPAELAALFAKAGVKPGDTIVGYCHIGQQATGMLFAARSLGYKVMLYDGSFEDWSAHKDYPVETARQ
jgi:thiosulfate/3-mercaptopyruvate sulfurtransferase